MKQPRLLIAMFSMFMVLASCSSDDSDSDIPEGNEGNENPDPTEELSSAKDITSFTFNIGGTDYQAMIDGTAITSTFPSGTDVTSMNPSIVISADATVSPGSGESVDFTNVVTYTVTAEDKSNKQYYVDVNVEEEASLELHTFTFTNLAEGQASSSWINKVPTDIDTLRYMVPHLSPITMLESEIFISDGATIEPASGVVLDYTDLVKFTLSAEGFEDKEFLLWADNSLRQLQIDGILGNQFRDAAPGDNITFDVNVVNPVLANNNVQLVGDQTYNLEVVSANEETNMVTVKLPSEYINGRYRLNMSVHEGNSDESDSFILDRGTINFNGLSDVEDKNDMEIPRPTLVVPDERFEIEMVLDRSEFDQYEFKLRQAGTNSILRAELDVNFEKVRFNMPSLDDNNLVNGSNVELVIVLNGEESVFPLTNSEGANIEVLVGGEPMVTGTDKTSYGKSDMIAISGQNLLLPYFDRDHETDLFLKRGGRQVILKSEQTDASGNVVFDLSDQKLTAGTYEIGFKNNIGTIPNVESSVTMEVSLEDSEHPNLEVTEAKIFLDSSPMFAKQLLITFNQSLGDATPTKIVLQKFGGDSLEIGSYLNQGSTQIITGELSDEDYNTYRTTSDGYVIVEDNGQEYKIHFIVFLGI